MRSITTCSATPLATMLLMLVIASVALLAAGCGEDLPTRGGDASDQRVVLAELFTTTWCGWCPDAEAAMDSLFSVEGPDELAVVHWHSSYGQGDPYAIDESDERAALYTDFLGNPPGFPVCVYNGVVHIKGGSNHLYSDYRTGYESEASLNGELDLEITPSIAGGSAVADVNINPRHDFASPGSYNLVVAAVEHEAKAGHLTTSYVARRATTQTITIAAEQPQTLQVALALDPTWKRDDLWIVAFIQDMQPSGNHLFREVIQAAMTRLVSEEEDFYAFSLLAPDATLSVMIGGELSASIAVQNTGTLDDTLTIDLPSELATIPDGWTVALQLAGGTPLTLPAQFPLAAGTSLDDLRLEVAATEGVANLALVAVSHGDPALSDTLNFRIESGTYGLQLQADTELDVLDGVPYTAPLSVKNVGTVEDYVLLDLPDSLLAPIGWQFALTDPIGNVIATPCEREIAAGAELDFMLRVVAAGEGLGNATFTARSERDPDVAEQLTFTIQARTHNLDLSAEQTAWQIVVGALTAVPFEITNSGSHGDLFSIDLDTSYLPGDWTVELALGEQTLPTPYPLFLEAGEIDDLTVRIVAGSSGYGVLRVIGTCTGDPSIHESLQFDLTADEYGLSLIAPAGTDIRLTSGTASYAPVEIINSGTLADTVVVDLPAEGVDLPPEWDAALLAGDSTSIALPYAAPLEPGASRSFLLRVQGNGSGSGTVQVTAFSRGLPSVHQTLTFTASASPYSFTLEGETDIIVEEYGPKFAPFTFTNTGSVPDVYQLVAPLALQHAPEDWGPAILCFEGACYPPGYTLEAPLDPGAAETRYYVDWVVPGPGTGVVGLIVTSKGDPALSDTLTFTYTAAKTAQLGAGLPLSVR